MSKDNSRILIGKISGCFGVKGWLKVFSYSHPRENITSYENWIIGDKLYQSVVAKKNGKLVVAKLDGIDDKDTAQTFIGLNIEVEKQYLKTLTGNQFYWHDLVGLDVTNTKGVAFGKVKSLLETGANDVVIVKGDRERLIPYITNDTNEKTIIKIDLEGNSMLVDWHEDD